MSKVQGPVVLSSVGRGRWTLDPGCGQMGNRLVEDMGNRSSVLRRAPEAPPALSANGHGAVVNRTSHSPRRSVSKPTSCRRGASVRNSRRRCHLIPLPRRRADFVAARIRTSGSRRARPAARACSARPAAGRRGRHAAARVVLGEEAREAPLLRAPSRRGGPGGLVLEHAITVSCAPFCPGHPGAMRSGWMPNCNHQTARRESPARPLPANGAPLSLRIRSGRP